MGIKEILISATDILEIVDQSPLIMTAILKLLLAVLHRIFGPKDLDEWCTLWNNGVWDAPRLSAYLDSWKDRFYLIDDDHPFYQSGEDFAKNEISVTKIAHEMAAGNNDTLFDHHYKNKAESWPLDDMARHVVAFQPFAVGGTQGKAGRTEDGPLVRGVTVMAYGTNLFETLALNLVPLSITYTGFEPSAEDKPAWEQNTPRVPTNKGVKPLGYLDYLTWQSTGLRLLLNSRGECDKIKLRQNLATSKEIMDPLKCFKKTAKGEILPVRFSTIRSLWRDSAAMFRISDIEAEIGTRRPAIFDLMQDAIIDKGLTLPPVVIVVCGMELNKAKIKAWCFDRLPFELDFISKIELMNALDHCIKISERVATLFGLGKDSSIEKEMMPVRFLLKSLGCGTNDMGKMASALNFWGMYWSSLGSPFQELVHDLCIQPDIKEPIATWKQTIEKIAADTFYTATKHLLSSTAGIKAQIIAEKKFRGLLRYWLAKNDEIIEETEENEGVGDNEQER